MGMTLEEPQAIAVTQNNVTDNFNVNVGIRQGEVFIYHYTPTNAPVYFTI
jgi:hypothetical protein